MDQYNAVVDKQGVQRWGVPTRTVVAETVDSPSGSLDSSKVSHAQIQMKNQYNEMVAQIWVSC